MIRFLAATLIGTCLLLPAACQSRDKTYFPAVEGTAIDVSTGSPVEGATISAERTDETAITDAEGGFSLSAVIAVDKSIPLPVSGVYRDSATLEAQADGARAYSPADFISVGAGALSPVTFFMMGRDAPYTRGDVPEACELSDQDVYALQVLGLEDRGVMRGVFARELEFAFAFQNWLDQRLVRKLPKSCDVALPQLMTWLEEIDTLFDGLGN